MDLRGGKLLVGLADTASRSPLDCSSPSGTIPQTRTRSVAAFAAAANSPRLHGVGSILSHSSQWLGADFFLVVHVREARDLGPGRSATCDPLVRVSLQRGGGAKPRPLLEAETRVLLRNRNPMWEQSLTFPLDHVSEDMELQLRVRDNDIRHFESFMGQVSLSMWEVLNAVAELGQEISYSMPLYDDSGLGRLRPGTLAFGVAVHAKSTYKELLASRAALQDPSQIQQLLQPYTLHLQLQGLRGLAGPAAAPGAGLAVHVGLAGYGASRPLRCAVVGGEADPPDMELAVPLGRALAGVAGLKGKAAARAQFGDVRIELHNSKGRLLAKTQVPLWSVPFQHQHPQHPHQQHQHQHQQQQQLQQVADAPHAVHGHSPPRQDRQQGEPEPAAPAPGGPGADAAGAEAGAGAGTGDAGAAEEDCGSQQVGTSSAGNGIGSGCGSGSAAATAGSGSSTHAAAAAAAGPSKSPVSSPFAQASSAAAAAAGVAAAADASATTAEDDSTRSRGSSSAAGISEGDGTGSSSSRSSDRTSFSAASAAAEGPPGDAVGSRGGEPGAAVAAEVAAVEAAVAAYDPSYNRHSLDSGLSPPPLSASRCLGAKELGANPAVATPATVVAVAAAVAPAETTPAADAAPPAVAPLWAGRRYCRRMERVDKSALSGAPTVIVNMQLCLAAAPPAEGDLSLLGEELAAAVSRPSASAASLASTSASGWREVMQADGAYSGASASGGSAAPSHLKSLAGGLTRPLVRGFTTLIGVVAGAGEGSGGGGVGNNDGTSSSSGSISAAAAAAGSAGSAGSGGSSLVTGAVLAPPPPQGRRTGSTTAGSAAASTLATTSAQSGAAGPAAHSDAPQPPPGAPALQGHMRADVPPAAAAAAAATDADAVLTHSPNADPFDFWSVDVAEPCLAALLPPLPPLEHVVGDFVVRTGPHELANALFGHQSPVTARVADGMGVTAAVVVVGWGPDKDGRAPMARYMTYLTPTPLVGTTPVEHTQRMVAKTDAGFIVENRITPNPMGVGRVVTITVQVVGRHAGPGKTRLTASLKAEWYGSRALYLLKGRVLAACPKESRGYYKQLRAELDKVFGAEDVSPDTEGAVATAATRARVAAAAAAADASPAAAQPTPVPVALSGVAPGYVETADADNEALAAAAALAASGGSAAGAAAVLRTMSSRRRGLSTAGAALTAAADGAAPSQAGGLLVAAALVLLLVALALGFVLWTALGALRSATEELADSRRQLERAAGLLEAAAAAAVQAAATAVGRAPGVEVTPAACMAGE